MKYNAKRNIMAVTATLMAVTMTGEVLAQGFPTRSGASQPARSTDVETGGVLASDFDAIAREARAAGSVDDNGAGVQARRQISGDFGDLPRNTSALPLAAIQDAWSAPVENMAPGQTRPGTVRFSWSPEQTMELRLREVMITNVQLPDWESVRPENILIGDDIYLEVAVTKKNVMVMRPSRAGFDTNVVVQGDSGNIYNFYVRSEGVNTKDITDMLVFVDVKPSARSQSGMMSSATDAYMNKYRSPATAGTAPAPQNVFGAPKGESYNIYDKSNEINAGFHHPSRERPSAEQIKFNVKLLENSPGDRVIAPALAYTDGVWTYFEWPEGGLKSQRPIVFQMIDGIETRVNTRTIGENGQILVAEALGDFVLRLGQKVVCVKYVETEEAVASSDDGVIAKFRQGASL